MQPEREITYEVQLCDPLGRLNPQAVGWTRAPLHRVNLRGWGRIKRWEHWGVVGPRHVLGLTISSLDYAGVHGIYVLDRATGAETRRDAVVPLARRTRLTDHCGLDRSTGRARDLLITFDEVDGATRLRAEAAGVELELLAARPAGHEALGVVVPSRGRGARLFQYTVKDLARPVHGRLVLAGETFRLEDADSFGVLDHGRGRWPYRAGWTWAAGSGRVDGALRAIQLGGGWTDGTGSTENALLVAGRLHKISEDLTWRYDPRDWLAPWTITGEQVAATFHPEHVRHAGTNLGVLASRTHQCFGTFTGWACADSGARVGLDGLTGWAEQARHRW